MQINKLGQIASTRTRFWARKGQRDHASKWLALYRAATGRENYHVFGNQGIGN